MTVAEPRAERPLAGRRIAILEHRELDRLGAMLEAQGAETLRCPLIDIVDAPDAAPVAAWLSRFVARPPDDFVLMTGEGLRRLRAFAERKGIEAAFRDTLGRVRTVTRGPKPARALRELGLNPGLRAEHPTSEGIVAALAEGALAGRRVGVQLYPDAPPTVVDFLAKAGALPDPVWPYAYVASVGDAEIVQLITEVAGGRVDAVAFTSAAQVARLWEAAGAAELDAKLSAALRQTAIAAVGPVVAGELKRRGLDAQIMPEGSFFMKPLVTAIANALAR